MVNIDRDVAGCAAAHQRLLGSLQDLTDDDARRPTLLTGWTVGHVLTHLARNADSLVGLIEAAGRGEVGLQYPSNEARHHDIDAGAGRSARELVRDVRSTVYALEQCWAAASAQAWQGAGRNAMGSIPIVEVPWRRWREVEVHHADLGLGFGRADWSAEYVRQELVRMEMIWSSRQPMGLTELPAAALALAPTDRLAWLLGRLDVPGLGEAGVF